MSASSRPIRRPPRASATARFTATVDLPTPPLPDATPMTLRTCGIGWGSGTARGGGAAGEAGPRGCTSKRPAPASAVSTTWARRTWGTAASAASAAARTAWKRSVSPAGASSMKPARPGPMASP